MSFVPGPAPLGLMPSPGDLCLPTDGSLVRLAPDGEFLRIRDVPDLEDPRYLGQLDGETAWSCVDTGPGQSWPQLAARLEPAPAALAGRAMRTVSWRREHRYCGACRAELADVPGYSWPRCTGCGILVPVRLSPAVLVAIRRGTEILLVRHSYGPTDIWALVAGFVEGSESLEDAVRREVREEVGAEITDLVYAGSQPWAMDDPGVLLVGFTARWLSGEPIADGVELTRAEWFAPDALPADLPPAYSIARDLIEAHRLSG